MFAIIICSPIERRLPNESDTVRNRDAHKASTTIERTRPNGSDAVGNRDARKVVAKIERTFGNESCPVFDRAFARKICIHCD